MKAIFKNKTAEQIFSICLFISCIAFMIFCTILRLGGFLLFSADLLKIKISNRFLQELISAILLIFELIFVFKILCRSKWYICAIISIIEASICGLIGWLTNGAQIFTNIFMLICMFIIPLLFIKNWFVLIESAILYLLFMTYGVLFSFGRFGIIDVNSSNNFIYGIISTIDFKLFFVASYILIKYFGEIKLWKKQKRLIFQTELTM